MPRGDEERARVLIDLVNRMYSTITGFLISFLVAIAVTILRAEKIGSLQLLTLVSLFVAVALVYGRVNARYKRIIGAILRGEITEPEEIPSLFPLRIRR